jgi:cbb3-type cytochrome oxidase cytochrome c subunit
LLKKGEQIFFIVAAIMTVLAVASTLWRTLGRDESRPVKDYYEWSDAAVQGYEVYKKMGCKNCHKVLRMGESGVAPVLDGEGTRRNADWIVDYFDDPQSRVKGSAHAGGMAPDFRQLEAKDRSLLIEFMKGLKSNPGSSNYPVPPERLKRTQ